MYCPKCSQQQPSEEMRFCSRCGFTLAGVALVLDNNGIIPEVTAETDPTRRSWRNRILAESAIFTVITWAVALCATFWFDYGGAFENVAKVAALVFGILGLIGLLRFMYGFLFVTEASTKAVGSASKQKGINEESVRAALPPQQSLPISDYPLRVNTREMSPRLSVTENTTRLLDEQPPARNE